MNVLIVMARMALALVFTVAGYTKLVDRSGTEKAVAEFGVSLRSAKTNSNSITVC